MVDTFYCKSNNNKIPDRKESIKKEIDGFLDFKNQYVSYCLLGAVNSGLYDEANKWIKAGANVNYVEFNSKYTPLFNASCIGDYKVVKLLIDNGANVNHINDIGCTALSIACQYGYSDVVKILLEHIETPLINYKNVLSVTPISKAIANGSLETVKLLVEHGADITDTVPLAFSYKHNDIANYLIGKGAKIPFTCVFNAGFNRYFKQFTK